MPRLCLAAALVFVSFAPARGQEAVPAERYAAVVRQLTPFVRHEVETKGLPALSVALVDDQTVVWAQGFGYSDPRAKKPATAETVYRVGSVSKLFTDLAVMRLVERGALDLDAPVRKYLPDFKPSNPFGKEITLRQLMTHRSGLVRESPVGNYFDPTGPSLAKTVRSLNQTELVYEPETKIKYSNAGIAAVGLVLEQTQGQPFARYLSRTLLAPLGMKRSSFAPEPEITKDLAKALMWTYQGREFPAPTFELGMAPAGCMYSTVNDLARFLSVLFAGGKGPGGVIVKPQTLEEMYKPQFARGGDGPQFGLGFMVDKLEGKRRIGHGGAIYGFSTQLEALPDEKLGVVVIASRDVTNPVVSRIAELALRQMLAAKQGKPLPKPETTAPLKPEVARKWAGRWKAGDKVLDLLERDGHLWALPGRGNFRVELRAQGDALISDGRLGFGTKLEPDGEKLRTGEDVYERVEVTEPKPIPEKWAGLIGEYGWDHDTLYILERDGKLCALIEWFFLYPLTEVSADVYKFPSWGLYQDEKLVFRRDGKGRATAVEAACVLFERRKIDGENGETFKITPQRPVGELRRAALAAKPPQEKGDFRKSDLVELISLGPTIKLDVRYATTNNFLNTPFYPTAKAYMQRPAAEALVRVHKKLAARGYGLLVYDGYRPWSVTKMFWDATPQKQRVFVADPSQGSRHNRGCAVDLTLYDLKSSKPVEMVGGYDEFSDRSYPDYLGGTSRQRYHRDLLRRAMEAEGFTVYEAEWWHFDYKDWRKYRIGNLSFEEIAAGKKE